MKTLFTVLGCLLLQLSYAQEFAIKQVELAGEKVKLYYDLVDTTNQRTYTIYVYSSKDNFGAPLTKLSGDAGLEVRPGINRRIEWNVKEEFCAGFVGDIELEIRGRVYVPFIRFEGLSNTDVRKRGTPFIMKWNGGTRQNILNFQLYRGDKLVHTFPNVANASEHKMILPTSIKPGSSYFFRVADSKNPDQVVITAPFRIKRKVPLLLKALPIAALGAAIPFILPEAAPDPLGPPPGEPGAKN